MSNVVPTALDFFACLYYQNVAPTALGYFENFISSEETTIW